MKKISLSAFLVLASANATFCSLGQAWQEANQAGTNVQEAVMNLGEKTVTLVGTSISEAKTRSFAAAQVCYQQANKSSFSQKMKKGWVNFKKQFLTGWALLMATGAQKFNDAAEIACDEVERLEEQAKEFTN